MKIEIQKSVDNPSSIRPLGIGDVTRIALEFFNREILPNVLSIIPLDAKPVQRDEINDWEVTLVLSILGMNIYYKIVVSGVTGDVTEYRRIEAI